MSEGVKNLSSALHNLPIHLSERAILRSSGRSDLQGERVLYWTHHALRVDENPALDVASHLAHCLRLPLLVYQGLSENYRFASDRHHTFILEAARDLQTAYANLGISFALHLERRNQRYERRVDRAVANPLPRIAMIGTGLGGLMCSRVLQDHGLQVQCFDKSNRSGGRSATRQAGDSSQFDHGAQYFTIRDQHLKRSLESWIAEGHVAQWHGQIVSIDEPHNFNELPPVQRYVGTPKMESLAQHLATDLGIQFETEVQAVARTANGYQLLGKDHRELGFYDLVLWNCPPAQTLKQIPPDCSWRETLNKVAMVPCWAVMVALEQRWDLPLDGAFVNRGMLSWIARDSSKPSRPDCLDSWVLHSSANWATQNIEKPPEQVVELLISEAERVTGCDMPKRLITKAHRWLSSRPLESLPDAFLWDDDNWLGACGDWCGGPRMEGALKSGLSLAGRVLGALHEHSSTGIDATAPSQGQPQQLTLFDHR